MRTSTYVVAMLGWALAIVIGGIYAVERMTRDPDPPAVQETADQPGREALRVPPDSGGPPVQFRWSDLRRMELHRGLKHLSAVLGMPLEMTRQWQQLMARFNSDDPLSYDELRFIIERFRALAMRAHQRLLHQQEQEESQNLPPRQERSFERDLAGESEEWTGPFPVDGASRDLRFEAFTLTNAGNAPVRDVRLTVNGHPSWHTIDELLAEALAAGGSDRDKAMALYRFFLENRFHWSAHGGGQMHDPVKLFNVWGGGICDDVSQCFVRMAHRAGLKARVWALEGHQVPEAFFDGGWHVLDVDIGTTFPLADGQTLAGVAELADPANVAILQRAYRQRATPKQVRTYTQAFQTTGNNQTVGAASAPLSRIRVDLLPGQKVTWRRANAGQWFSSLMWYAPAEYSNLVTDWDVTASKAALQSCRLAGLQTLDTPEGVAVSPTGPQGTLVVPFASCYPLVGGAFSCTVVGDEKSHVAVSLKVGRQPWLDLTAAAFKFQDGNRRTCKDLSPFLAIANGRPDYQLQIKLTLTGRVEVRRVGLQMIGQLATRSLPRLQQGENRFAWTCATRQPNVKLRFRWSEGPTLQPLAPPEAPLSPAQDAEVPPLKDVTLRWLAPAADLAGRAPPGIAYQLRVFPHPDSAFPIVPYRSRHITRTHCELSGEWLLPGRTIGWEVRCRQHAGPWSPWSRRFTFRTGRGG